MQMHNAPSIPGQESDDHTEMSKEILDQIMALMHKYMMKDGSVDKPDGSGAADEGESPDEEKKELADGSEDTPDDTAKDAIAGLSLGIKDEPVDAEEKSSFFRPKMKEKTPGIAVMVGMGQKPKMPRGFAKKK